MGRALWLLMHTYPHRIGDKLPLKRIENALAFGNSTHARCFLMFHGVSVVDDPAAHGGAHVIMPRQGTPEGLQHKLLTRYNKLPDKCEFPMRPDSLLEEKFKRL